MAKQNFDRRGYSQLILDLLFDHNFSLCHRYEVIVLEKARRTPMTLVRERKVFENVHESEWVRERERERESRDRKGTLQRVFYTSCLSKESLLLLLLQQRTYHQKCLQTKSKLLISKKPKSFCRCETMEDVLQKILREASSEKYAHISAKATQANGKGWWFFATCSTLWLSLKCHLSENKNIRFNRW